MESIIALIVALLMSAQKAGVSIEDKKMALNIANCAMVELANRQSPAHATITPMPEQPIKEAAPAPEFPTVGTLTDGRPVYKGTNTFVVGADGCHYTATKGPNDLWTVGKFKVWCPK